MLSEKEKIFLEKELWEHCKIDAKKMGPRKGQRFHAVIFSKKPPNDSKWTFGATLVSFILTLCCIV